MIGEGRQRIDKWLWYARFAKTRTLAQKLALSGRVRINREKCESASQSVKAGDVLTIAFDSGVRALRIATLGQRRGRSGEARLLYEDLTPPTESAPLNGMSPERGGGRPTKRDRRAIDSMERGIGEDFSLPDE